jgi:hypothetical protein
MPSQSFYYTRASFIANASKIILTPLNPGDTGVSYIITYFTDLINENGGNGGTLFLTESVRVINGEQTVDANYSMQTPSGDLKFGWVMPTPVFSIGDKYNTVATYRSGEYVSSGFPIINMEVLDDASATRKYTVSY